MNLLGKPIRSRQGRLTGSLCLFGPSSRGLMWVKALAFRVQ